MTKLQDIKQNKMYITILIACTFFFSRFSLPYSSSEYLTNNSSDRSISMQHFHCLQYKDINLHAFLVLPCMTFHQNLCPSQYLKNLEDHHS